jgi:hypothetical protein
MAKHLVRNNSRHRLVWAGRLRFRPGQQMWLSDELLGLVQRHIDSGAFIVLAVQGAAVPVPEPAPAIEPELAPEPAPEPAPAIEPEPAPAIEPELAPAIEPEPALEPAPLSPSHSSAELKAMRLAELRPLAASLGIGHSGIRKADLVAAILATQGES